MFFVLSGYLITALLLREEDRGQKSDCHHPVFLTGLAKSLPSMIA